MVLSQPPKRVSTALMISPRSAEFLSRELLINKQIVTFRWLSRELAIHVNEAKKELDGFYEDCLLNKRAVYATYLLIGDVNAEASLHETDANTASHDSSPTQKKIMLVGESQLEEAKRHFLQSPSSHIYSLSPVALTDAALLTTVADRIRSMDLDKGRERNESLGMIVSPNVQVGEITKSRSPEPTKRVTAASSKQPMVNVKQDNIAEDAVSSKKEAQNPPPKKVNTLDWSKAKPKTVKRKETTTKEESAKETSSQGSPKDGESIQPKRGTKRPSDAMDIPSSGQDKSSASGSKSSLPSPSPPNPSMKQENKKKVKPGIILSDGEEQARELSNKRTSSANKSRKRVLLSDEEEEEEEMNSNNVNNEEKSGEDAEMLLDDGPAIPSIPKVRAKRKPKASVPIGRNGLPKKAVQKTRKTKNAKGYTVTEDYFSYESVSEAEATTPSAKVPTQEDSDVNRGLKTERLRGSGMEASKSNSAKDQEKKKKSTKKDLNSYFSKKS